jgi:hypothetical protein
LTEQEYRQVEKWLYSITRIEIAIEGLKKALEQLDTRRASPPTWMSNPTAIPVMGGDLDSRQQRWAEFLDEYNNQRTDLLQHIQEKESQLDCFNKVLDQLRDEDGKLAQLVRYKYLHKIKPDSVIYENHIYVSRTEFYRMRSYIIQFFYDCYAETLFRKVS